MDSETDLFEDWNRYLDSSVGRYLQPEPVLSNTKYLRSTVLQGASVLVYFYALNNPIHYTDDDGLAPWDPPWIPPKVPGAPHAICEPGHQETRVRSSAKKTTRETLKSVGRVEASGTSG